MQIMDSWACTTLEYSAKTSKGHLSFTRMCWVCQTFPLCRCSLTLMCMCIHFASQSSNFDLRSGLKINEARPDDKLPYRGAWLWVGSEMIHLMELPNPDPLTGRPAHGGRDRHTCVEIQGVSKLKAILDKAGDFPPPHHSFILYRPRNRFSFWFHLSSQNVFHFLPLGNPKRNIREIPKFYCFCAHRKHRTIHDTKRTGFWKMIF